ncbi:MAG: hypothetical protein C4519_00440 [Desulfobacteraceae bacterium]|nr:MAG: hypothetical protein C4519_00440 [Desulfobacteraceae bacterium]
MPEKRFLQMILPLILKGMTPGQIAHHRGINTSNLLKITRQHRRVLLSLKKQGRPLPDWVL